MRKFASNEVVFFEANSDAYANGGVQTNRKKEAKNFFAQIRSLMAEVN